MRSGVVIRGSIGIALAMINHFLPTLKAAADSDIWPSPQTWVFVTVGALASGLIAWRLFIDGSNERARTIQQPKTP